MEQSKKCGSKKKGGGMSNGSRITFTTANDGGVEFSR